MSIQRPLGVAYDDDSYSRLTPTDRRDEILTEPVIVLRGTVATGAKSAIGRRVEMSLTRKQLQELLDFYDSCEARWPWTPPEETG